MSDEKVPDDAIPVSIEDGFSHVGVAFKIIHHWSADGSPLTENPLTRDKNLVFFASYCLSYLIDEAFQNERVLKLVLGEDGKSQRMSEAALEIEPFSIDWYHARIILLKHDIDEFIQEKFDIDSVLERAMQLGATCREYQLSSQNREAVRRAQLDAKRRKEGGEGRAHPDRNAIVQAIRRRVEEQGQTDRQAARAAFDVDHLGTSPQANLSIWKREKLKKRDRS